MEDVLLYSILFLDLCFILDMVTYGHNCQCINCKRKNKQNKTKKTKQNKTKTKNKNKNKKQK